MTTPLLNQLFNKAISVYSGHCTVVVLPANGQETAKTKPSNRSTRSRQQARIGYRMLWISTSAIMDEIIQYTRIRIIGMQRLLLYII